MSRKKGANRRRFLKSAAQVTTSAIAFPHIIPSSCLAKAGRVGPNGHIVMGCIGVGGQGKHNMRAFMEHEGARVVAVCDVQAGRREEAKNIVDSRYGDKVCASYNDFRDLLARKDIDAVVIAPQDHWHAVIAVAAAQAGKDMYCEKPLGVAVVEGQAMRDAVRRYGGTADFYR